MKKSADSNASTPPPFPLPQSSPAIHLNRAPAQTHISVSLEVTRCTYTHIHTGARGSAKAPTFTRGTTGVKTSASSWGCYDWAFSSVYGFLRIMKIQKKKRYRLKIFFSLSRLQDHKRCVYFFLSWMQSFVKTFLQPLCLGDTKGLLVT